MLPGNVFGLLYVIVASRLFVYERPSLGFECVNRVEFLAKVEVVLAEWNRATATPEQIAAWLRKAVGVSDYLLRHPENRSVRAFVGRNRDQVEQACSTVRAYLVGLKEWNEYLDKRALSRETILK